MESPVAIIGGIITLFFVTIVVMAFLSSLSDITTDTKCAPYKSQIAAKDQEIRDLKDQINTTNEQLVNCQTDYNYLVENEVTKKDVEDVKRYFQIIQAQITSLNNKFDSVNTNYYTFQENTIKYYNYSLALNFVLSIEILSFFFLKNELIMFLIEWVKKKRRKNETKN